MKLHFQEAWVRGKAVWSRLKCDKKTFEVVCRLHVVEMCFKGAVWYNNDDTNRRGSKKMCKRADDPKVFSIFLIYAIYLSLSTYLINISCRILQIKTCTTQFRCGLAVFMLNTLLTVKKKKKWGKTRSSLNRNNSRRSSGNMTTLTVTMVICFSQCELSSESFFSGG